MIKRYTALNGAFGEHESGAVVLYEDHLEEIDRIKGEISASIDNFTLGFIGVDKMIEEISKTIEK